MRTLLVFGDKKNFKVTVADDAKVTFGPWAPPKSGDRGYGNEESRRGTIRIYGRTKEDILAVFSGVTGFRDLSIGYAEEIAKEEGATIWKDDEKGYVRESKVKRTTEWHPDPLALPEQE